MDLNKNIQGAFLTHLAQNSMNKRSFPVVFHKSSFWLTNSTQIFNKNPKTVSINNDSFIEYPIAFAGGR